MQDQTAMVFDLTTGNLVNWPALVSKSAHATTYTGTDYEGNMVTGAILPPLEKIAVDSAETECKHAFQHPQPFLLWPDAKKETLVARPFDLPHAVQACASSIRLSIDQARNLGFDENLLHAIRQAHHSAAAPSAHPPPRRNTSAELQ